MKERKSFISHHVDSHPPEFFSHYLLLLGFSAPECQNRMR